MLRDQQSPWLPIEPTDGMILPISLPSANASLTVRFQLNKRRFQILLRFAHARGKQMFNLLNGDRTAINSEFSKPPSWGTLKEPTVSIHLDDSTIKDPLDWPDQHMWIAERLGEFHNAVFFRLTELERQLPRKNPAKDLQLEYWKVFRKVIEGSGGPINSKKPRPQCWQDFAIGRAGVILTALMNTQAKRLAAQITLVGPNAKPFFYLLRKKKTELEQKFGRPFDWDEAPTRKQSRIRIVRDGFDPLDRSSWPDQHGWLLEQLYKLHDTFADTVKQLDIDSYKHEK
jgi:hypothetical protein